MKVNYSSELLGGDRRKQREIVARRNIWNREAILTVNETNLLSFHKVHQKVWLLILELQFFENLPTIIILFGGKYLGPIKCSQCNKCKRRQNRMCTVFIILKLYIYIYSYLPINRERYKQHWNATLSRPVWLEYSKQMDESDRWSQKENSISQCRPLWQSNI